MMGARGWRARSRRAALVGMSGVYKMTGRTSRSRRRPGLTVLLLHNTPSADVARLAKLIDDDRGRFVNFSEGVRAATEGQIGEPAVCFSFDDGFTSNLSAAEMLAERGLSGCFYVPTGVVGLARPEVDRFFGRPQSEGVMTWRDLERLVAGGHVVGSHCRQHIPMSGLSESEAEDQLKGSVAELRSRLGVAHHFAWPFGGLQHAPAAKVVHWAREAGVIAASGVRGRNGRTRFDAEGYLRRDAVDVRWLRTDLNVFGVRDMMRS